MSAYNPLWNSKDLAKATGGKLLGKGFEVTGISIDSRTVKPGELFIALKGPNHDGHDHVEEVIAKGAHPLVHHKGVSQGILVKDTFEALYALGRAARARTSAKVIAVTGSVGKTGVKEALAHVLSSFGKIHAAVGSFNNHWGVPLTLARMPEDAEFAVIEIGMNHAGEIRPLSQLAAPHIALVTEVQGVHMEFFSHVEEIARAKAEIFEGLVKGGIAILPEDNPFFGLLGDMALSCGASRLIGFGRAPKAQYRLERAAVHLTGTCAKANVMGEPLTFKTGQVGTHHARNALGVLAAAELATGDLARSAIALANLHPPKGRGARHFVKTADGAPALVIDESYNASPPSMRAMLDVLTKTEIGAKGRKIAILGDMAELGDISASEHEALADHCAGLDLVITLGAEMGTLFEALPVNLRGPHFTSVQELVAQVPAMLRPNDVVAIKGSRSQGLDKLVDAFEREDEIDAL